MTSTLGLTSTLLLHVGPVPIERHHASIYLVYFIFLMMGRVFLRGITAQMAKEEFRVVKISDKLHRLISKGRDYELVPFVINRIRMYLGMKKQKKIIGTIKLMKKKGLSLSFSPLNPASLNDYLICQLKCLNT